MTTKSEDRRGAYWFASPPAADSDSKRFSERNRQLIRRLQEKNALKICHIPEDLYSGGEYRDYLVDMSDAMLAIGGGKGTYLTGNTMLAERKPVIPMDIRIGARREDGEGALKLLSEMKDDPKAFLPRRHEIVSARLSALSLEGACPPVQRIANEVADIFKTELEGAAAEAEDSESNGDNERPRRWLDKTQPIAQFAANLTAIARNALDFAKNLIGLGIFG